MHNERAIEAGMLHGIDAYNDSLGQGSSSRSPHGPHCPPDCHCWDAEIDREEEARRFEEVTIERGDLEDLYEKIRSHERYIEQLQERLRKARGR